MDRFIEKFKKGTQYVKVVSAVTENEMTRLNVVSDGYVKYRCAKFIPASGAATRMFKDLYQYLDDQMETDFIVAFFDNLEQFAFYNDLKGFIESGEINKESIEGRIDIIRIILTDELKYGSLPKALIKTHSYRDCTTTPIDEHIYEGEHYLQGIL